MGLGEIQVQKVIELDYKFIPGIVLNAENPDHVDWIIETLEDPKISIDYIGRNIVDMQDYIDKELTIPEVTFCHNEGKESLKKNIPIEVGTNRISDRSLGYQKAIEDALKGKINSTKDNDRK